MKKSKVPEFRILGIKNVNVRSSRTDKIKVQEPRRSRFYNREEGKVWLQNWALANLARRGCLATRMIISVQENRIQMAAMCRSPEQSDGSSWDSSIVSGPNRRTPRRTEANQSYHMGIHFRRNKLWETKTSVTFKFNEIVIFYWYNGFPSIAISRRFSKLKKRNYVIIFQKMPRAVDVSKKTASIPKKNI